MLALTLFSFSTSQAGIEPEIKEYITGDSFSYFNSEVIVFDNKSYDASGSAVGSYSSYGYKEYQIQNTAYLELNEYLDSCYLDTFSISVQLKIEYKDINGNLITDTAELTINYDTSLLNRNTEISSYTFNGGLWSKVTILSISNTSFQNYIKVGQTLTIERYRDIATTAIVFNTISVITSTDEAKFSWNTIDGAEEYDFEWMWVDGYTPTGLKSSADIDIDFRNNATRVTTTSSSYTISSAYEMGYIVARVRPVGRNKDKIKQITNGDWSLGTSNTSLTAFSENSDYIKTLATGSSFKTLNDEMNWQYVATFAESGKRKEVVSYYDGSLRNRQSVTRISTGMHAVVGETIYDFEGRPSVNILPVPAFDSKLGFHAAFNISQATDKTYNKKDFDSSPTTICQADVAVLKNSSGASKYYSSNNPNIANRADGHIPDAEGFPMTVTEYMPDGTGRIKRQGGVGSNHQLGSNHETKYYYATPGAQELYRLFGNAVGDSTHYQKEMVLDPNGQASVSYKDLSGKVIATALGGNSPDSMAALGSGDTAETVLYASLPSVYSPTSNEIWMSKDIIVSSQNTKHEISYSVEIPRLSFDSMPDICFDCVYELEISLKDDCGLELLDGDASEAGNQPIIRTLGKVNQDFDTICEDSLLRYAFYLDSTLNNDSALTVFLDQGKYTLFKTLRISNAAYEFYYDRFITSDQVKTFSDFENDMLALEDTLNCDFDCDECEQNLGTYSTYLTQRYSDLLSAGIDSATIELAAEGEYDALQKECIALCADTSGSCMVYYLTCLYDMEIGGQYAEYTIDSITGEITSASGLLDISRTGFLNANYKEYKNVSNLWVSLDYLDADGNSISVDIDGVDYSPNELSLKDYIYYFEDTWLPTIVQFHPEFCRYTTCRDNEASFDYDQAMLAIDNYKDAFKLGYLDPLAQDATIPTLEDPYFSANDSAKSTFLANYVNSYVEFIPSCGSKSILEIALLTFYSTGDFANCTEMNDWLTAFDMTDTTVLCDDRSDAAWEMFKAVYITQKQKYFESNSVTCTPTIPDPYTLRFTALDDIASEVDVDDTETDGDVIGDTANTRVMTQCDISCDGQASYWLEKLGGCNLDSITKANLIDTFKVICKNGCDPEHPWGAFDYPTSIDQRFGTQFYSFEDAFNAMVPFEDRQDGKCNVWNIASPKGYSSNIYNANGMNDSCIINGSTDTCYTTGSDAFKGFNTATSAVLGSDGCEDCISCNEYITVLGLFDSTFADIYPDTLDNFYALKTNFLNNKLGFNLTYWDYEDFENDCYLCDSTIDGDSTSFIYAALDIIDELIQDSLLYRNYEFNGYLYCNNSTQDVIPGYDSVAILNTFNSTAGYPEYIDLFQISNPVSKGITWGGYPNTYADLSCNLNYYQGFYRKPSTSYVFISGSVVTGINDGTSKLTLDLNETSYVYEISSGTYKSLDDSILFNNYYNSNNPFNKIYVKSYHNNYNEDASFSSTVGDKLFDLSKYSQNGGTLTGLYTSILYDRNYYRISPRFEIDGTETDNPCEININVEGLLIQNILEVLSSQTIDRNSFNATIKYIDIYGDLDTADIVIGTTCNYLSCPLDDTISLCNRPYGTIDLVIPPPCITWKRMRAGTYASIAHKNYLDSLKLAFKDEYYGTCLEAKDTVDLQYEIKEYHYTLYYYDQAGNLIQTVPPAGVDVITSQVTLQNIAKAKKGLIDPIYPNHSLVTRYQYNSLNEVRWQKTPDGGISEFWYDRLGRMAVSQNAQQADQSPLDYSYTLYDSLGRISEVGQLSQQIAISKTTAFDNASLESWLDDGSKQQITRTWYDTSPFGLYVKGFSQDNLRGRVVSMAYYERDDYLYKHAIHYSYDIHGNVKILDRENTYLRDVLQDHKLIMYDYDLVSGNVNTVYYQRGMDDQFTHRYLYDADNRLTTVFTSSDNIHWDQDASYYYYLHGPLKRVEIGGLKVQGMDYSYTLHGWLKGVNSNSKHQQRDIGQDGYGSGNNAKVARDVFGYSLHYYKEDYTPINSWNTTDKSNYFLMEETATSGFNNHVKELYNGNISRMVTALDKLGTTSIGKAYEYDQLNRISKSFTFTNYVNNVWQNGAANSDFYSDYSYDANGNLLTLNRNAGNGIAMDSLSYHYISMSNQLSFVDDDVSSTTFSNDIDDQELDNYTYDKIGNLISDVAEEIIDIEWTVYGKIKSITRSGSAMPFNRGKNITYINVVGASVEVSTNVLTRNGSNGYSNGARSKELIYGDGSMEWILGTATDNNFVFVGLTYDEGYGTDIDYSWYISPSGIAYAKHKNAGIYTAGTLQEGDVLKVERKGEFIYWYVNGGLPVAHLEETRKDSALMIDLTMYNANTKINKLTIYGATDTSQTVSSKPNLQFEYSPDGHRVAKHVLDPTGDIKSTYYVRDASGNIMATYNAEDSEPDSLDNKNAMDVYNYLDSTLVYSDVLDFLDNQVQWSTLVTTTFVDSLAGELDSTSNQLNLVNYFASTFYLSDNTVFDALLDNQITANEMILAFRAAGYNDEWIVSNICNNGCQDSLLDAMMTYDYAQFLTILEQTDLPRFDHLVTTLSIDTLLSVPDKVTNIILLSSIANTTNLLSVYSHDCSVYSIIYSSLVLPNSAPSLALLGSVGGIKTCLRSALQDDALLGTILMTHLTNSVMWDRILALNINTLTFYVSDISNTFRSQFLVRSLELLQDPVLMKQGVSGIENKELETWLTFVKTSFDRSYYDQLVLALFGDLGLEDWLYKLNEHHIYGSSRLGVVENNLLLASKASNRTEVKVYKYVDDIIENNQIDFTHIAFDQNTVQTDTGSILTLASSLDNGGNAQEFVYGDCKAEVYINSNNLNEITYTGLSSQSFAGIETGMDYFMLFRFSDPNYLYHHPNYGYNLTSSIPKQSGDIMGVERKGNWIYYYILRNGTRMDIASILETTQNMPLTMVYQSYRTNAVIAPKFYKNTNVEYVLMNEGSKVRSFYRGQKRYEFSNHLGNVLAVVTDRRIQSCLVGEVAHYKAQVVSLSDYYPFGMQIKERNWNAIVSSNEDYIKSTPTSFTLVSWTNKLNDLGDGEYEVLSTDNWEATGASSEDFYGDCRVEYEVNSNGQTDDDAFIGLTYQQPNGWYGYIDYRIKYNSTTGEYSYGVIGTSGLTSTSVYSQTGDKMTVERDGEVIYLYILRADETKVFLQTVTENSPGSPVHPAFVGYHNGTILKVNFFLMEDISIMIDENIDLVSLNTALCQQLSDGTISIGSTGSFTGGSSKQQMKTNGKVKWRLDNVSSSEYTMVGLSYSENGVSTESINYGIYHDYTLYTDYRVYENGNAVTATSVTKQNGDTAVIERLDGTIFYYILRSDGTRIELTNTPESSPSQPMVVDFSSKGSGHILDIQMSRIQIQHFNYRFGFNGQESDPMINGEGNSYAFKYRIHDTRLGRFLSVDPMSASYASNSTYAFAENRVMDGVDLEGLEWLDSDQAFVLQTDGFSINIAYKKIDALGTALFHSCNAFVNPNQYRGSNSSNMTKVVINPTLIVLDFEHIEVEKQVNTGMNIKEPKKGTSRVIKGSKTLMPAVKDGKISVRVVNAASTGLPDRRFKDRSVTTQDAVGLAKTKRLSGIMAVAKTLKLTVTLGQQVNLVSDYNKVYDQLIVIQSALASLNEAAENGIISLEGIDKDEFAEMVEVMMTGKSSADWGVLKTDKPGVYSSMNRAYENAWKVIEYAAMDPKSKAERAEAQSATVDQSDPAAVEEFNVEGFNSGIDNILNRQQDATAPTNTTYRIH